MDMINKLRSTVSSVSNSLSTVLPGNPVTREYEIEKHIASAGPGLLWKIYEGVKKSTKEEAAIFVLQKSQLEKYSKRDRELIIDVLKKGVSQLTRLRHPAILTVQHPLEESRESLAFATEPIFASLANVVGHHENMPTPPPAHLKDYKLQDVEIKYGLLQLSEGLAFLHNDVKLLHRNICPESIIINRSGAWKLSGFEFALANSSQPDQAPFYAYKEWDGDLPPVTQPSLDYLAPEYGLTMSCGPESDIYSLGALIYCIYSQGTNLNNNCSSWSLYKENAQALKKLNASTLSLFPQNLVEHAKMLLNVTPQLRPDALQFSKIAFFEDVGVKTLQYLDSLFQWDNLQKSHFYRGLAQVIKTLPKRVNLHRILPCLVNEYVNPEMIPFVLPNVLLISDLASKDEFAKFILPDLIPVFKIQQPIQILLIFMQQMELLLTKCNANQIRDHILPMIYTSLESDAQQIQELSLHIIPNFAHLIDFPSIKNALLPRIKKLCIATEYVSVRVNCLVCIGQLLEHLDKWIIMDDVFPALQQIKSKEPAVLMGIVGIYKMTLSHKKLGISKDVMATKIIPFLMPLSIENGLTLNQFNAVIGLIKELVNTVETEHKAKLEQLNSIRQEQCHTVNMAQSIGNPPNILASIDQPKSQDSAAQSVFKDLGLDSYMDGNREASKAKSVPQNQPSKCSLSLADKQKLVQQQEAKLRFDSQKTLTPTPSETNVNTNYKTKDLTSSLINSNLANMSLSSTNYNINRQPMSQGHSMPSLGQNMQRPAFGMMPPAPLQPQPNMAAFDSLMMTSSNRPRLSMNQMQMGHQSNFVGLQSNQGIMQPHKTEMSQSSSLSSDLNDLLS